MRRSIIPLSILVLTLVTVYAVFRMFWQTETRRLVEVGHMSAAPSEIYARMLKRYDKPPVYEEEWRLRDVEGTTSYDYRIRAYNGVQITITAPPHRTYDVSYFFGKLDQDGVWQIVNQPPRGNTDVHYTVYVKQLADYKAGDRTVTFTDPHYWATTAGRQYNIDLSKTSPGALLTMQSTQLADKRYQMVVDDFENFGPPGFRAKIAAARARIKRGK